jgi:peptidoglycan/LPS O-acetylase OafA/YrhL
MDPVSSLPAIASLLVAVATSLFLVKRFGAPPSEGRYASIDGLRGYLAFFVFLHHSCVWYFYLNTGRWELPPSNLYSHFGQSSVVLFFMITGFLFFSKLVAGKTSPIDWGKLFVSRFLRLTPLYVFVVLLLFVIVGYLSGGTANESLSKLMVGAVRWLGFTALGGPNLNGVEDTYVIVAGVMWTLPYEWLFYFSLPLLALTVGVRAPFTYLVLSCAIVAAAIILFLTVKHPSIALLFAFLGGIAASVLVLFEPFRKYSKGMVPSFAIVGCLSTAVALYSTPYSPGPLFLLFIAFSLIACGNDLFGFLRSPVSRTIGQMAYSIYLLHGITLFAVFSIFIGTAESKGLSPAEFWFIVVGVTPVLLLLSFSTFCCIERPTMHLTAVFTAWLRSRRFMSTKAQVVNLSPEGRP